jgi:hypothetical protein
MKSDETSPIARPLEPPQLDDRRRIGRIRRTRRSATN